MEKGWLSHLKIIAFTQALHSNFILQTDRHSWRKEKVIQVELSLDAAQTEIVIKGATKRSNSGNSTLKKEWQKLPTRRAQMHLGGRIFRSA